MVPIREKIHNSTYILTVFLCLLLIVTFKTFIYKDNTRSICAVNNHIPTHFQSSLLLGFKKNIDSNTTAYRTLWIKPDDNNNLKVVGQTDSIIVPHKNTFWKIEPLRYNFINTEDYTQYLVAHEADSNYIPETFEYNYSTYNLVLDFVDKNYVSILTSINFHGKDLKEFTDKSCSVVDLENLTNFRHTENRITMTDIFKSDSNTVIKKLKKSKVTLGESLDDTAVNTTSGDYWSIGRYDGQWIPQIAKTFKSSNNNSNYILYNTQLKLPQSIVSHNKLCTSLNSIKKVIPEAEDAISSPKEDILGVFTTDKLTFYPYSNGFIGKESLSIDLDKDETMIMDQWTDGYSVDQWDKALSKYFTNNS
ncbi:hypothetical protein [Clostridium sp. DJ247]|uniref:hypothetical protein n=1 Tax=Clostridium sp. DJ247 TaxID=2726188 RepID=UPI001628946C|nr:hypothetical protein [Clostridium sp. DJ247]MBC2580779.1 hypothetical protein [Clostridium sp. DJ247]